MDRFLIELLEEKYREYNRSSFIDEDPIAVPHLFTKKENIEIAGFLTATIAWGQRKTIIRNATRLKEIIESLTNVENYETGMSTIRQKKFSIPEFITYIFRAELSYDASRDLLS